MFSKAQRWIIFEFFYKNDFAFAGRKIITTCNDFFNKVIFFQNYPDRFCNWDLVKNCHVFLKSINAFETCLRDTIRLIILHDNLIYL